VPLAALQLAYRGYAHPKASGYLYLSAPGTAHARTLRCGKAEDSARSATTCESNAKPATSLANQR
jgi:hypothetical protein